MSTENGKTPNLNTNPIAWRWRRLRKWMKPGIGIKRWLLLLAIGIVALVLAAAEFMIAIHVDRIVQPALHVLTLGFLPPLARVVLGSIVGTTAIYLGLRGLNYSILMPFRREHRRPIYQMVVNHGRLQRGIRMVALGGGTGLPAVLRGFKKQTSNITAIVTVADDGGSSGKLRRELGVLPPGDLRNNIAALANDEALMTQLFQYRFDMGGLEGHSFGNLFLTALADITGSMDTALTEAGNVLLINGRVLPATLHNVELGAEVYDPQSGVLRRVVGESQIPKVGGRIERVFLVPENVRAYPESIRAILGAELVVIGPGSLFTSILPTIIVNGVAEAIRASSALCVYVCNIAMQQGETEGFSAAEHILAIERHVGRGVVNVVVANNATPELNAGPNTRYVLPAPPDHEVRRRYEFYEADLIDPERPWRHSPEKLNRAIMNVLTRRQVQPRDQGEPLGV